MAGSLNHIVKEDGTFTAELVENNKDKQESLEECHQIIAWLLIKLGDPSVLKIACAEMAFPDSEVPVIQPELHGFYSIFKETVSG